MRAMKHLFSAAAAGLVVVSLSGGAHADGVALQSRYLAKNELATLKAEIAKAKRQNPTVFKKVAEAPKMAVEVDERKRGRVASITLPLNALGKDALYPMLEMLAIDAQPRGKMSDSAWTTLRSGLIEAVGLIRDKRARPVLETILRRESEFEMVRAATEALGRIGDDASAKKLAKLALTPNSKQPAVISGIGECRRIVAAEALAKLIGSGDEAQELLVIKSLGTVGNAWAWDTPDISKSGEGAKVRAIAAAALMKAFVSNTGYARDKAARALLVVNDPSTPKLIAHAKAGARGELAQALDELAFKIQHNPAK